MFRISVIRALSLFWILSFGDLDLFGISDFVLGIWSVAKGLTILYLSRILYKSTSFLQNKPNFPKTKMNLNICSERNYEDKSPIPSLRKQTQSNPIFKLCPQQIANPGSRVTVLPSEARRAKEGHRSRASIMQNKPNLQKCETNRNIYPTRTYETATARNSRKNKANLQKCKNEPNHLFAKDLRKITPFNSINLAYNSAPIR